MTHRFRVKHLAQLAQMNQVLLNRREQQRDQLLERYGQLWKEQQRLLQYQQELDERQQHLLEQRGFHRSERVQQDGFLES